jgi:hypothetical protein
MLFAQMPQTSGRFPGHITMHHPAESAPVTASVSSAYKPWLSHIHQPSDLPVLATQHVHVCGVFPYSTVVLVSLLGRQMRFSISHQCFPSAAGTACWLSAQAVICLVDLVWGGMHDIVFGLPTHTHCLSIDIISLHTL